MDGALDVSLETKHDELGGRNIESPCTLVKNESVSAALHVMPPGMYLTHFHSLDGVRI